MKGFLVLCGDKLEGVDITLDCETAICHSVLTQTLPIIDEYKTASGRVQREVFPGQEIICFGNNQPLQAR